MVSSSAARRPVARSRARPQGRWRGVGSCRRAPLGGRQPRKGTAGWATAAPTPTATGHLHPLLPLPAAAMASSIASSAPSRMGLGLGLGAMGLGLLVPTDPAPEPAPEPSRGVLRLRGAVQHYEWGRRGGASLVVCHAGGGGEGGVDPDRPYAELWMGTHPSAPSSLASDDDISLREWLARGRAVAARWGSNLPFLFKVLSVAKALYIQAHPDRELARALHALRPATYPDGNHKPEMAVAVTEFRALCGFAGIQREVRRASPHAPRLPRRRHGTRGARRAHRCLPRRGAAQPVRVGITAVPAVPRRGGPCRMEGVQGKEMPTRGPRPSLATFNAMILVSCHRELVRVADGLLA